MKFLTFVFLSVSVLFGCNEMRSSEPVTPEKGIIIAADKINKAILEHDYEAFAKYTHPKIVAMLGGEKEFKEKTAQGAKQMEADSAKFVAIINGKPTKMITKDGELQTTLPQTIEIKIPQGKIQAKSTLIAISQDNGQNWLFINTTNSDLKKLQQSIPTLSDELVIPPAERPELVPDK